MASRTHDSQSVQKTSDQSESLSTTSTPKWTNMSSPRRLRATLRTLEQEKQSLERQVKLMESLVSETKRGQEASVKLRLETEYGSKVRHYEGLPSRIEQLEETIERLNTDCLDVRRRNDVLSEEMAVQLAANRLLVKERDTHERNHKNAEQRHTYTKETLSRLQTRLEAHEAEKRERTSTILRLEDIIRQDTADMQELRDEIQRLKAHIGTIEGQMQLERARNASDSDTN